MYLMTYCPVPAAPADLDQHYLVELKELTLDQLCDDLTLEEEVEVCDFGSVSDRMGELISISPDGGHYSVKVLAEESAWALLHQAVQLQIARPDILTTPELQKAVDREIYLRTHVTHVEDLF